MLMPKPLWIGQVGDYWFGDYEGEYPVVDGPDAGTAGTVDTVTRGEPGYRVHSFCCCGRVPPPDTIICCDDWQAAQALAGKDLKIIIGNPCGGATLVWDPFGSEWSGTQSCTPDGGLPVTIDIRVQCLTNEEEGVDQYKLFVSCNNPNPPGGFESWEGFPATQTPCPTNDNGLSSVQLTWLVPEICGVQLTLAGWGGNIIPE